MPIAFLSVDPLVAQTEQSYAYALADPLNVPDPSGLCLIKELCPQLVPHMYIYTCSGPYGAAFGSVFTDAGKNLQYGAARKLAARIFNKFRNRFDPEGLSGA